MEHRIDLLNRKLTTYFNQADPEIDDNEFKDIDKFFEHIVEHSMNVAAYYNDPNTQTIAILASLSTYIEFYLTDIETSNTIRSVYKFVERPLHGDNKIKYVSSAEALILYIDYIEGMIEYLLSLYKKDKIQQGTISDEMFHKITQALRQTSEADKRFIEDKLFSGMDDTNHATTVQLTTAIHNIELLVPFQNTIDSFMDLMNNFKAELTTPSTDKTKSIESCILYVIGRSMSRFVKAMIKNGIDTLCEIALYGKNTGTAICETKGKLIII